MIIGPFQTLNTGSLCLYCTCRPGAMYPFECVACNDYEYYTVQYMYSYIKKKTHEFQEKVYGTNAIMYVCTGLGKKSIFGTHYCYPWLWIVRVTM